MKTKSLIVALWLVSLGDWPDIDVVVDPNSPVNFTSYTVTETTKGQPDMSKYILSYDGRPSTAIDVGASAADVSSLYVLHPIKYVIF